MATDERHPGDAAGALMDAGQLAQVCALYGLGTPLGDPRPVTGGFLHRMWRVTTSTGSYAVKELNPEIMRKGGVRDEYRRSEEIAARMAAGGVPAATARRVDGDPLREVGGATVMVFDWVDGRTLPWGPVSPAQGRQVGAILGRMHALRPDARGLAPPDPPAFDGRAWAALVARADARGASWAAEARAALPDLDCWSEQCTEACAALGRALVVSHRDLDQKNVLWCDDDDDREDGGEWPMVVDWEAAGLVNSAMELAGVALDWSGQPSGPVDEATLAAVVGGYREAGGIAREVGCEALYGVMGNWLNWLLHSMRRSLDGATAGERGIGAHETVRTLGILRRLSSDEDRLLALLGGRTCA